MFQKGSRKDYFAFASTLESIEMTVARLTYDTSCAVTNLVILAFGRLDEKLRNLMFHFHLAQNRCTIVRDDELSFGGLNLKTRM